MAYIVADRSTLCSDFFRTMVHRESLQLIVADFWKACCWSCWSFFESAQPLCLPFHFLCNMFFEPQTWIYNNTFFSNFQIGENDIRMNHQCEGPPSISGLSLYFFDILMVLISIRLHFGVSSILQSVFWILIEKRHKMRDCKRILHRVKNALT